MEAIFFLARREDAMRVAASDDLPCEPLTDPLRLDDPSPLGRAMAIWACAQLLEGADFERLREQRMAGERDPQVRAEWQPVTKAFQV